MNTKLTAVLMAAIMVATCAAVIVSADQAEAKNNDVIEVDPVNFNGNTGTLTLYMNKYEYDGYVNNVVWKFDKDADRSFSGIIGNDSNNPVDVVVDGDKNVTSYYEAQSEGKYKFTFTNLDITGDKTIKLKCELSVNVNGQNKVMNLFYNVPLNLSETDDGYDIPNGQTLPLNTKNATVMVPFNEKVYGGQDVDAISKYQGYNWYAVGLPDGLSMNMDGTITGVPTKATSSAGVEVSVVAVEKSTSLQKSGKFTFVVKTGLVDSKGDGTGDVSYTFSVKVGEDDALYDPSTVLAIQDEKVVMTIESDKEDMFTNVGVTVVDTTGEVLNTLAGGDIEDVKDSNDSSKVVSSKKAYEIPTNGTGAYRVIITAGTGDPLSSDYYDLIVISDIEDIRSGIIVQGA